MPYYNVVLNLPSRVGDGFTYFSETPLEKGRRVSVPLGNRTETGFITADAEEVPGAKPVLDLLDEFPLLTEEMLDLTKWMSRRYFASWYQCIETALPSALKRRGKKTAPKRRVLSATIDASEAEKKFSDERILSAFLWLIEHPETFTAAELTRRFDISRSPIDTWIKNDWADVTYIAQNRRPYISESAKRTEPPDLTAEQTAALEELRAEAKKDSGGEALLQGVTGSGKTEVYLRIMKEMLEAGKSAILLVPEISLTPQTVDRIVSRLGDTVALLHSQLSAGERQDEWMRIRRGEARIVVGARSAVFAPVHKLGLIVVDEAHETSYKQSDTPRYNALDLARERVSRNNALLIFGTASPTLEIAQAASKRVRLTERVLNLPMPQATVVDMRKELMKGNRSIFSSRLDRGLKKVLQKKEQAILFLNRRGHASFVLCRTCGEAIECPRCDISLTLHRSRREKAPFLVCHMCNHRSAQPKACPKCGSGAIKTFGAGTERVEMETKKKYPEARVVRMDADTTTKKGAHREILDAFSAGEYDILVGTQMIGKGLDLPRVTLVGVIAADASLHLPDFRAAERTFNILMQVIGRSGRSALGGEAIIQSYNPEHYAVELAAEHNIDAFLELEGKTRKAMRMPPYERLIQWSFESEDDELARKTAFEAGELLRSAPGELLGPAPAPIPRLRGRSRWQIRWQFPPTLGQEEIEQAVLPVQKLKKQKDVRVIIDVDPMDML